MAGLNGSAILLHFDPDATGTDTYTLLPCQVSGEYSLSVNAIDTSCKDSADDTNIPGARSRTLSVEANLTVWPRLTVSTDAISLLRRSAETGLQVKFEVVVGGTPYEEGTATITGLSISAPREDESTASFELAVSGALEPL